MDSRLCQLQNALSERTQQLQQTQQQLTMQQQQVDSRMAKLTDITKVGAPLSIKSPVNATNSVVLQVWDISFL